MFNDEEQGVTPETVTEEVAETETGEVEDSEPEVEESVDWEQEAKRLQAELGRKQREFTKVAKKATVPPSGLDVADYIDISSALDGLDAREKARLAEEHKLTGRPLKDIRGGEDYQLWQSAYRAKMEKELALKPSSTQVTEDVPKSAGAQLKNASLAEKEALLKKLGLYTESRPRADRAEIGSKRSR